MVALWLLLQIVAGSSMAGMLGYTFSSKRDMAQNKELCTSPVCQKRAEHILHSINGAVEPCEDFYAYVCGKLNSSTFGNMSRTSNIKVMGILDSWPEMTEARTATEKAVIFFRACMQSYNTAKENLAAINKILNEEGYAEWPLPTRKENQVKRFSSIEDVLLLTGTEGLFQVTVLTKLLSNETGVLGLEADIFSDIPDEVGDSRLTSRTTPETKMGRRATAEEWNEIGNRCARIKAEIREIEKTINNSEIYGETTFASLEFQVPSLSLLKVINRAVQIVNVTLRPDDRVVISYPEFFIGYLKFLARQNPDDIYNCQGMNRAKHLLSSLLGTILDGLPKEQVLATLESLAPMYCLTKVMAHAAPVLTRLYVLQDSDVHLRRSEARSLLNDVGKALYTTLQFVPWLDRKTRQRAILKLKALAPVVGFPENILNETHLEVLYANMGPLQQNATMSEISVEFERNNRATAFMYMRKGVESTSLNDFLYGDAGALYVLDINSMVILDGILGGLYFQSGLPRYLNLGSFGSVIGHELTHGFDSEGRHFDETGKTSDWWSNHTSQLFEGKAACFVEQYGSIVDPVTQMPIDGKRTLVQNIADNAGIRLAHKAFRTYDLQSTEVGLPGLDNFTSEQLFFISYASIWCGIRAPSHEVYSPVKYRVNVPLKNMEEFSEAFQCKKGSHMRLGDHERCILW